MENTASFNSPNPQSQLEQYYPFLKEARKRLVTVLIVFALATIIGFSLYEEIIKFLIDLLSLEGVNIVFTSPFQFINLAISCGAAVGLIVSLPFLVFQILSFLKPALKKREFKMIVTSIPFTVTLFAVGFAFGAFVMKWQITLFLEKSYALGIGNILDISRLLQTVLITSSLMGLAFQFPIFVLLFLKIGLISRRKLIKIRKWVYVGSLVFAVLLPADSIPADILLSMPLIVLFELAILIDKIQNRS